MSRKKVCDISYKRKASVLVVTLILLVVAASGVMALVNFVNNSQRTSERDRDYIAAFYAAESGIEKVVDFFNNPENYNSTTPGYYTDNNLDTHPEAYDSVAAFAPGAYGVFETYWTRIATDGTGEPVPDADGNVIVTGDTYFRNTSAGSALDVSLTSKIPSFDIETEEIEIGAENYLTVVDLEDMQFLDVNDRRNSWINEIEIINPNDMDRDELEMITESGIPVICKIISSGTTNSGSVVSVESIISESRARGFDSPAAILSEQAVDYNGQFNVHWGELWGRQDIDLPSNWENFVPTYGTGFTAGRGSNSPVDEWFAIRATGWIKDHRGKYANGFDDRGDPEFTANRPPESASSYEKPFDETGQMEDYQNFFQNQTLEWPEYDYDEWRKFVLEFDFPYFYAATDGDLWGEDEDGELVKKSFAEWFDADDPNADDYWALENIIVFIDGVPQNANGNTSDVINDEFKPLHPDDPDKVDVTIRVAGGGLHTRGVMLVSPDMKMTGQGNTGVTGADIPEIAGGGFEMPDGSRYSDERNVDIFHHGLLWGWGKMEIGGNRTIYGSIHAADGYGQGGSPSVWYNANMKDGGWISLNRSRVKRDLWNISKRSEYPDETIN